jgi:hypothetical protein
LFNDAGSRELLAGVSSFANTADDFVFGMAESAGGDGEPKYRDSA